MKDTLFYSREALVYSSKRYPVKTTEYSHFLFKRRLKIVLQFAASLNIKGGTLLEIGCADGYVLREVFKLINPDKAIGIDLSDKMLEAAKAKSGEKLEFYQRGIEPEICADIIVETGVLNFTDPRKEAEYAFSHLKDEGYYIVSFAAKKSLHNFLNNQEADYHNLLSRKEYINLIKDKFEVVKFRPYGFYVPTIWKLPVLAAIIQSVFEKVFYLFPSLYHEEIYLLRKS